MELHYETLDSGSPHGRRHCGVIPCVRGRQDYRSGPRRLRRWFRMEAGGRHSPESRLVGTSLSDLGSKMPAAAKSIGPVGNGFLAVNPDAFASDFAADPPKPVARFMAISQVPVSSEAFDAKAT